MVKRKHSFGLRRQMLASYSVMVGLILVVGLMGIFYIRRVYSNGYDVYQNNLMSVNCLKSIGQNMKGIDHCVVSLIGPLREEGSSEYLDRIQELQEKNQRLMSEYSGFHVSSMEKTRYQQYQKSMMTYNERLTKVLQSIQAILKEEDEKEQERLEKVVVLMYQDELVPVKKTTGELLDITVDLTTKSAKLKLDENREMCDRFIYIIVMVMLVAIVVAAVTAVYTSNRFTYKLTQIQDLAVRISEYNLSNDIEDTGTDEFGETMQALNEAQYMLRELLKKITEESISIENIGIDVAEAVSKAKNKIEALNVAWEKEKDQITRDKIDKLQNNLAELAMYFEQIEITAKHENEIVNNHRVQAERFQISNEEEEPDEPKEDETEDKTGKKG